MEEGHTARAQRVCGLRLGEERAHEVECPRPRGMREPAQQVKNFARPVRARLEAGRC